MFRCEPVFESFDTIFCETFIDYIFVSFGPYVFGEIGTLYLGLARGAFDEHFDIVSGRWLIVRFAAMIVLLNF